MSWAAAGFALSAVSTVVGAIGQARQGRAAQAQARYQAAVARNNQIIANRAAEDARRRGEIEANIQRQASRQLQGRQRAILAGQGVAVDVGSAGVLIEETAGLGELDALTIVSNAEREALGFEAQGMSFGAEAQLEQLRGQSARTGSFFKAGATLLSGFGSVSSKWAEFKRKT